MAGHLYAKVTEKYIIGMARSNNDIIGASLSEAQTSVTALRTRVSIYLSICLSVCLWTGHLPEILNLRIYKICMCTCALQIQI